jgi:tRNA A-37 threonylcarbamoyl transferase component Bud32
MRAQVPSASPGYRPEAAVEGGFCIRAAGSRRRLRGCSPFCSGSVPAVSGRRAPAQALAGRMLAGRYKLMAPIARGGMAEVWEGFDEVLSRPVAVKVLDTAKATDGLFLERFRREAVSMARVVHPGVVATYDTGVDDGTAYIVMELVRGRTLRRLLKEHGLLVPWLAVGIAAQVADALTPAHAIGLVHRDIKPANILLVDGERPVPQAKITDFGIAKAGAGLGGDLTDTGVVLGTPKYLSPEQVRGEEPDHRADLYALGVVLYEMLAGQPPFVGGNDMEIAMAHLQQPVPALSALVWGLPDGLEALVCGLLSKNPADRPVSAAQVRDHLDQLKLAPPGSGVAAPVPGVPGPTPPGSGVDTPVPGVPGPTPSGWTRGRGPDPTGRLGPDPTGHLGPDPTGGRGPDPTGRLGPDPTGHLGPDPTGRRPRWAHRAPGLLVLLLSLAATAVVAGLIASGLVGSAGRPSGGASGAHKIASVTVWVVDSRPPDDPGGVGYTFDGNPATYWITDRYSTPDFGGLYPGIGLEIELAKDSTLHGLAVTSPSTGWAAETFVSGHEVPSGAGLGAWGSPTDSRRGIRGDATFDLGGRPGRWVLLWLTYLGPARQCAIAELAVS